MPPCFSGWVSPLIVHGTVYEQWRGTADEVHPVTADSLQMRFGEVEGQPLHARWWRKSAILEALTLLVKVWIC